MAVGGNSAATTPAGPKRRALRALRYAVVTLADGVAGYALAGAVRTAPDSTPTYRPFITEAVQVGEPVWSPDGRTLAYVAEIDGRSQIFLRGIDAARSTQLTKQATDGISLCWSPDGNWIAYRRLRNGS